MRTLTLALVMLAYAATACGDGGNADRTQTSIVSTRTAVATATSQPPATASPAVETATAGVPPGETIVPIATEPPAPAGPSITISAVGDISLARQVNDWLAQYGASYPYELTQHLLTGDVVFGNLEGALTDGGEPWPKAFTFRTPPRFAPGLATAGFDVVALANNHAMDFGITGLLDTMSALDSAGVAYAGTGLNDASAWAPAVIEANGLTVAFIACARSPDEGSGFSITMWTAPETSAGMAVCTPERVSSEVAAARPLYDFVVLSVHAGDEYINAPNATQVALADAALAAGADLFLGHHAHVVQPVEQRGSQLIAWGLSNFIFDLDRWDLAGIPEPRVSPILHVTLTKGAGVTSWRTDAVLLDADADRPRPATADEAAVLETLLLP